MTSAREPAGEFQWITIPALEGVEALRIEGATHPARVFAETYLISPAGARAGADWRYRQRDRTTEPFDYTMMEPGEAHAITRVRGPYDCHVFFVAPRLLDRVAAELGIAGSIHFAAAQGRAPALRRRLSSLSRRIAQGAGGLELETLLHEVLHDLVALHGERRPRAAPAGGAPASVQRARDLLMDRHAEEPTLTELAAAAGLSRFHLVREFRRAYGLPPHAYQLAVRVARARSFIARGMRLIDVADACGFADQSHFHRAFRRALGTTPGDYARSVRPGAAGDPPRRSRTAPRDPSDLRTLGRRR